ncbi:MAG: AMP-binding protein [Planctomycetaceae bacterium]|jgi:phenylacetate-CoA ligase|nr:AMP-binding protein [Planctomycetaceae bacterium]
MNDTDVVFPADRESLRRIQLQKLTGMCRELSHANPFWTQRLESVGLDAAAIDSWDAFAQIPLLQKSDLVACHAANPPYSSNLTYPLVRYSRLHQTSGTTGKPLRWLDTPASWDWLMECWKQIYHLVGLTPEDRVAFPFSFGPFIGFWAAFEGAQRLGNLCLSGGGMSSQARLRMILDNEATFLCCTPTYALRLAVVAEEEGINMADSAVRGIIVAGEPGGNIPAIRKQIETAFGARVFDHWGMTEIGALGVESVDYADGLYLLETECIAEIIDSETGQSVEAGETGELVITNLGRWGSPVIRYRTGDLVQEDVSGSPDGLCLKRLKGGVLGRADDMMTIRGNNVFPSSIDAIVREFDSVVEYRMHFTTKREMNHLKIEIEPIASLAGSDDEQQLLTDINRAIKDRLNFQAEIVAVEPESLPRFELKGRRFSKDGE